MGKIAKTVLIVLFLAGIFIGFYSIYDEAQIGYIPFYPFNVLSLAEKERACNNCVNLFFALILICPYLLYLTFRSSEKTPRIPLDIRELRLTFGHY
ncbi:MAG: hypothetical protein ABH830_01810 [Patescibacteria group bacterium]